MNSSKVVRIDEKIRGRNRKTGLVYKDVALEFVSVDTHDTPGWVCKPLACDYIAYAIAPLGVCYMLPVVPLQSAWTHHGERWKQKYGWRRAPNVGYNTLFCPVPWKELARHMFGELTVKFDAIQWLESGGSLLPTSLGGPDT